MNYDIINLNRLNSYNKSGNINGSYANKFIFSNVYSSLNDFGVNINENFYGRHKNEDSTFKEDSSVLEYDYNINTGYVDYSFLDNEKTNIEIKIDDTISAVVDDWRYQKLFKDLFVEYGENRGINDSSLYGRLVVSKTKYIGEDTSDTDLFNDKYIFWYDANNRGFNDASIYNLNNEKSNLHELPLFFLSNNDSIDGVSLRYSYESNYPFRSLKQRNKSIDENKIIGQSSYLSQNESLSGYMAKMYDFETSFYERIINAGDVPEYEDFNHWASMDYVYNSIDNNVNNNSGTLEISSYSVWVQIVDEDNNTIITADNIENNGISECTLTFNDNKTPIYFGSNTNCTYDSTNNVFVFTCNKCTGSLNSVTKTNDITVKVTDYNKNANLSYSLISLIHHITFYISVSTKVDKHVSFRIVNAVTNYKDTINVIKKCTYKSSFTTSTIEHILNKYGDKTDTISDDIATNFLDQSFNISFRTTYPFFNIFNDSTETCNFSKCFAGCFYNDGNDTLHFDESFNTIGDLEYKTNVSDTTMFSTNTKTKYINYNNITASLLNNITNTANVNYCVKIKHAESNITGTINFNDVYVDGIKAATLTNTFNFTPSEYHTISFKIKYEIGGYTQKDISDNSLYSFDNESKLVSDVLNTLSNQTIFKYNTNEHLICSSQMYDIKKYLLGETLENCVITNNKVITPTKVSSLDALKKNTNDFIYYFEWCNTDDNGNPITYEDTSYIKDSIGDIIENSVVCLDAKVYLKFKNTSNIGFIIDFITTTSLNQISESDSTTSLICNTTMNISDILTYIKLYGTSYNTNDESLDILSFNILSDDKNKKIDSSIIYDKNAIFIANEIMNIGDNSLDSTEFTFDDHTDHKYAILIIDKTTFEVKACSIFDKISNIIGECLTERYGLYAIEIQRDSSNNITSPKLVDKYNF